MIPFEAEQWMTEYEHACRLNIADTSLPSISLKDLETSSLQDLFLDYGDIDGSDAFNEVIASLYENASASQILPSIGCSQANVMILQALLKPEDEIIVFSPDYVQFERLARQLGASVKKIALDKQGQPDLDQLEQAISKKTRAICYTSPNNPMGAVLSAKNLEKLIQLARKKDLWIVCDEVYRIDQPSVSDLYEKAISSSSLSKIYGAAGLRSGWIKASPAFLDQVRYVKDYHFISAGPLSQALSIQILKKAPEIQLEAKEYLKTNKKIVRSWLDSSGYYSGNIFDSGNSMLLELPEQDDVFFCKSLVKETGVLLVPGSFYGTPGTARLGFGFKPEIGKEAFKKLEEFAREWSRKKV